jgi:hypothetical protein
MKLVALTLWIAATLHAGAQQHFTVTPRQVAHALLQRGLSVDDDQVSLVARIVAGSPEPELEVESVQWLGAADGTAIRAKVRVVCTQPPACVPFYAVVTWPAGPLPWTQPTPNRFAAFHPQSPIAMRAGSRATLLIDTVQMHLRVPVISLQNGAVGSTIHVASPDRKQTYTATILSPTLLTGSL